MAYTSRIILTFISGWVILSGCSKANYGSGNNRVVTLSSCSKPTLGSYICFDSLLSDSRCPKGVDCIWQGSAAIKVSFHEGGNIHSFGMSLHSYPYFGFPSDTTINDYQIIFKDLSPYPDADHPSPPGTPIKATFIISQ